jgi:Amt family ammonium transporter
MATLVVWALLDLTRTGKVTAVGAATGIVVGLVAITPAAGFISPGFAIVLGAIAAFPSYFVLLWRARSKLDDSLDVFAGHGVGGITGAILTGVFAQKSVNGVFDGLVAGNLNQVLVQALAAGTAVLVSGLGTFLLLKLVSLLTPLKATTKEEATGMDVTQHGEEAYTSGEGAILVADLPQTALKPKPQAGD